jgi:hypothetical protein
LIFIETLNEEVDLDFGHMLKVWRVYKRKREKGIKNDEPAKMKKKCMS